MTRNDSTAADVVVHAQNISRDFVIGDTKVTAVKECSLEIVSGAIVAIVGKSGSGKSTLCNLLSGLDRPSSGTVTLLGRDIAGLSDAEMAQLRASEIGFVLQKDNLVPSLTVVENVAAPLIFSGIKTKKAIESAREFLDRVGLIHRADSWPTTISGGEAQRAAVARACIGSPSVVFADEPTGALDRENGERVREIFRELVKEQNAAGVIVTHDRDMTSDADSVIDMADGAVSVSEAAAR